jgi:hypothetical protein
MTKFEFPEMSPRIFRPAPMVELEVGAAGAEGTGANEGEAAIGVGDADTGAVAGVAAGDTTGEDVVADAAASGVLIEEIAF